MEDLSFGPEILEELEDLPELSKVYYRTMKGRPVALKFVEWTKIGTEKAVLFAVIDEPRRHCIKILASRALKCLSLRPFR